MSRGFGSTLGVGSSDRVVTRSLGSTVPVKQTYSIWFYLRTSSGNLWSSSAQASANTSGNRLFFSVQFNGFSPFWSIAVTTGVWHHLMVAYDASNTSNLPQMYLDGKPMSVSTGQAPTGTYVVSTEQFTIGNNSTNNGPLDGMQAHFAYWRDILLGDMEAQMLASGINPSQIRPEYLRTYVPVDGFENPEPDAINGNTSSITGTQMGISEPFVGNPPRARRLFDNDMAAAIAAGFNPAWASGSNQVYGGSYA